MEAALATPAPTPDAAAAIDATDQAPASSSGGGDGGDGHWALALVLGTVVGLLVLGEFDRLIGGVLFSLW